MKKLLLALALLTPMINAESIDAQNSMNESEFTAEVIRLAAEFKVLRSFCIKEYPSIEQLFKDCGAIYAETFDLLSALEERGNEELTMKALGLHENLAPAVNDLNTLLGSLQKLNQKMADFDLMIEEATDVIQLMTLLRSIAQDIYTMQVALETIKEHESAIYAEALELSAQN